VVVRRAHVSRRDRPALSTQSTTPVLQVNVAPQSRQERLSQLYREDLEKMRLRARRESYCRYEEGGVVPPSDSLGYIAESERFITDIAAVAKNERDAEFTKREQMHFNKRMNKADAEEKRWRTIEMQHKLEEDRMKDMRENSTFARSNKTSMPYNPINLRYDDTNDGDRLRYSDDSLRHRGALRAEHLQQRSTSTGFNPITGEMIQRVSVPDAPHLPRG